MKAQAKFVFVSLGTLAVLGFSGLSASARIVCNTDGDCWHVHEDYTYAPAFGLTIHPDDWRWKEGDRYSWREHPGRGYWKGGQWEQF